MGLFDRFKKPKWKHKNPNVRIEAVKELDDQEILVDIAKNDSDSDVCMAAVEKISDEAFLIDVAKNGSDADVRSVSVERISDESVLIDIAKNNSERKAREAAVKKISDESVLIYIAKNDDYWRVREKAVWKIKDESVLIDIVKNDSDSDVREAAVNGISDGSVLADVAKSDSDWEVRLYAVKNNNLKDEDVLIHIAKNDPYDKKVSSYVKIGRKLERVHSREYPVRKAASDRLGGRYWEYTKPSEHTESHGTLEENRIWENKKNGRQCPHCRSYNVGVRRDAGIHCFDCGGDSLHYLKK